MTQYNLDNRIREYGFEDFKWIAGEDIVVRQWVRFKCQMMCSGYNNSAMCPPNMPSIDECRRFFSEYRTVAVIHEQVVSENDEGDEVLLGTVDQDLLALERQLFLDGYYKTIALPMTVCYRCDPCTGDLSTCRHKDTSRPNPEALGVDVFATVRRIGYPVEVLTDYHDWMNRYALVLIE